MKNSLLKLGKLAVAVGIMAAAGVIFITPANTQAVNKPQYEPGQLIIVLKDGHTIDELAALNKKYKVASAKRIFPDEPAPEEVLEKYKKELSGLEAKGNESRYLQLDKGSRKYKDYTTTLEKEKQGLQKKIDWQAGLIRVLAERKRKAPKDMIPPRLDTYYILKTDPAVSIPEMISEYTASGIVQYISPNYIMQLSSLPNDTYIDPDGDDLWSTGAWGQAYEDMWGLKKIEADKVWDYAKGSGVVVAVIDTGIDYNHPDLMLNMWEDAEGYHGYDFIDGEIGDPFPLPGPTPGMPTRNESHGTHVAGIIAATMNNNIGIAGVAPEAQIMALRVKTLAHFLMAIRYAMNMGAHIINLSSQFEGLSEGEINVIRGDVENAISQGCLFAFVAGNAVNPHHVDSVVPANLAKDHMEVFAVAASTQNDVVANFSNYGEYVVCAPGGGLYLPEGYDPGYTELNILSLRAAGIEPFPDTPGYYLVPANDANALCFRTWGTSQAVPYVSGLAALIIDANRKATPENPYDAYTNAEVSQVIKLSCDPIYSADNNTNIYPDPEAGYGRINAFRAVGIALFGFRADIVSPANGKVVRGTVIIKGNAYPGKTYTLYCDGHEIGSGVPMITGGALGMLDTTTLSDGQHILELKVTSYSDTEYYSFAEKIVVENETADLLPPQVLLSGVEPILFQPSGGELSYGLDVNWVVCPESSYCPYAHRSPGCNYTLERKRSSEGDEEFQVIKGSTEDCIPGRESYLDLGLEPATWYEYRVCYCCDVDDKSTCDTEHNGTRGKPQPPSDLIQTKATTTSITISWKEVSDVIGAYIIERSSDGGATFTQVAQVPFYQMEYTDTSVAAGVTYEYRVTASNADGSSDPSSAISVYVPTIALTSESGFSAATTTITTGADDAKGYKDLKEILFKIEDAAAPAKYVVLRYSVSTDTAGALLKNYYISNNVPDPANFASATWLGPYASLTHADTNGYVSLNVTSTTNTKTTTKITNNWNITFKPTAFGWGKKNLYLYAKDVQDNEAHPGWGSAVGDWFINDAPSLGVATSAKPTANTGEEVIFTSKYNDENGPSDIQEAQLLISKNNTVADNKKGFYARCVRQPDGTNTFELSSDGGLTWSAVLDNGYGTLDSSGSSASPTATNELTVTWKISFKDKIVTDNATTSFKIYTRTKDMHNASAGLTGGKGSQTINVAVALAAPTNVKASTAAPLPKIQLSWTDNSTSEDGFKIERSIDGSTFTEIGSAPANSTAYADSSLQGATNTTSYTYRVRAHKGTSYSAYATSASITTIGATQSSVSSASGSATVGQQTVFAVKCFKPTSSYTLKEMYILFNETLNEATGFKVKYDHQKGMLYLYDNATGTWLAGRRIGRLGSLVNANGSLDCAKAKATVSGGNTFIDLPISFTSSFSGAKNIYVRVIDTDGWDSDWQKKNAENETFTIGANTPPAVGEVTTATAGGKVYFTATYSDPDGVADIDAVAIVIGADETRSNAVAAGYLSSLNIIVLYDDTGTSLVGSCAPGSQYRDGEGNIMPFENSQGIIYCEDAIVTKAGNTMTVKWPVSFKEGFTGTKNIYLYVQDTAKQVVSGRKGTWTVQ